MENCDNEAFLDLKDELWAKMYPEQANAIVAQEGITVEDTLVAADANDRGERGELSTFFDDCDGGVMKIALLDVQKGEI